MFISKKRFEEAIKEAQEKAIIEAEKRCWENREMEGLHKEVAELRQTVEDLKNKGKKPRFRCPCMVFPNR